MLPIHDPIFTAGGLGLLVIALAAINSDIRRKIASIVAGDTRELALVPVPINRAARRAVATLRDYQTDNAALFAVGVAAVVLFGLLFKS